MSMAWLINLGAFGPILQGNVDPKQMGIAFIGFLILSLFLTIGAMETNKVLFFIFVFIDILFIGLAISTLVAEGQVHIIFHNIAGIAELMIALLSFYGCGANVLNNHFKRTFLPIGKPFQVFVKASN